MLAGSGSSNGLEKRRQQLLVQWAMRPKGRTNINAEWSNLSDRLSNIVGPQTSGEEHWTLDVGYDLSADFPVVHPTGAAEFANRSVRGARIEEEGVHEGCDGGSVRDCVGPRDVDDLYERHARKGGTKLSQSWKADSVDKLDRVDASFALVGDYRLWIQPGREEKRADARRYRLRDLANPGVGDDSHAARHFRHET